MQYNMSIADIVIRYVLMMALVITGGLMGNLWIMVLGLPFFLAAILGYCPIYGILGINTCKDDTTNEH